jgi:hypothetical protein
MVGRGITPLWRHRQRERFARAVDTRPADVDPGLAAELAVVDLLRTAAQTTSPDAAARERMRLRILNAQPPPTAAIATPLRTGARGRLAVAMAAALCLVLSLAGMSLLLSRGALPGDALYGMKRTAESASLGLTFGNESKALKRLEFAAARISEMETLADGGAAPLGSYLTALTDFDADAADGSRELTTIGANGDERVLTSLNQWAQVQTTRLTGLRSRLPAQAATRSGTSLELLARMSKRAVDLRGRTNCTPVTTGSADDIGPLPATSPCDTAPPTQGSSAPRPPSMLVSEPPPTVSQGRQPSAAPPVPGTSSQDPSILTTSDLPLPPITSVLPPVPTGGLPPLPLPLPLPLPGLPGIRGIG